MRRSFRAEDVLTVAHPASTGAATRSLHKSTWLTDDEPAPAGRGKDERRTCQHHQDSGRIIKTFEQIIKSSFRVMDLAMPLHPVDGQAGQDDGWPDCILTSRPIPGAWRPSVAADPNLSAILSASSYPFPTPGRRQRPNASMPGSRAALYGGLHMEAAVPWEEPAAAAAGYDAATSESDSAERSTPDAVVEAPKAKRRRKSRAQGSAEVMDKSSTSEKKVGRPRKAVDTSDCDDPEERRRRQIRLAQRAYRLRKESRISFLEARVSQLETSVDKMSAAVVSFGSKLVESKVLIPHAELRESLSETVQTCLESVRESSSRGEDEQDMQQLSLQTQAATTTPSMPLELYTAPLPPVDLSLLGPGNGSPAGSGGVLHLKHAEFMEKLHTSIVYYGYSLLADPSTPLELLSRHFRLTLAVMDRTRVLAYFAAALQAKLSRGRITGDWGDMPFFQLGGAGSHYSWLTERDKLMQNQIANGSSKQEEADAASAALALYSRRSRGWPRIAVSPDTLPSDVQDELEGEWFDMQDLELFLRERNTKLFRVDAAGAPTGSTPKPAPRSKGFINAEWLLRTLLHRATCLGRSAGFRRRDVEMALSGVIHS